MDQILLEVDHLPDESVFDLLNREAALWIAGTDSEIDENLDTLVSLIGLPWRMVLVESTSQKLRESLIRQDRPDQGLPSHRGYIHVIASDPSKIPLPRRALPVFFLGGITGAQEPEESASLGMLAATRRRLNMFNELSLASPKRLVILGGLGDKVMVSVSQLWQDDYRSRIVLVSSDVKRLHDAKGALEALGGLQIATLVNQGFKEFASDILDRALRLLPSSTIRIRLAIADDQVEDRDISNAELPEHPILDRYRLIRSDDLVRVSPEDLTKEDLTSFFDKSQIAWKPFAAGLPWIPDRSIVTGLLTDLTRLRRRGPDGNSVRYIWSEPGAGGTTLARALAYEAAQKGYPALVAEPTTATPDPLELAGFLYRVLQTEEAAATDKPTRHQSRSETPWLLVFEESHWEGHEAKLASLLAELRQSGRPVLVLIVLQTYLHPEIQKISGIKCIAELSHELSKEQAVDLGKHLNVYLKHLGEAKPDSDWISFWEQHRPDDSVNIASFWIALEFWLKGLINLGDSIQGWLWKNFRAADISPWMSRVLLQIASFTIQRRALPEALIRRDINERLPVSVLLEQLRYRVPALTLVQVHNDLGRCWALAHDIIGRYFISSAFFDRPFLVAIAMSDVTSQVDLRLRMLGEIARSPALGEHQLRPFAVELSVNIFKLEPEGNAEFFSYWRDVLAILDGVPVSISKSSRTFNHHVAISRRRVAIRDEFDASDDERVSQLSLAITQLEFALRTLDETRGDEGNLNLLNTLALTYQSRAELGLRIGEPTEKIIELRRRASETTREALARDPSNAFVLETAAKNLIQHGRFEKVDAVTTAAEALSYIFQAVSIDNSLSRQGQLARLANSALELLTAEGSDDSVDMLCDKGEAYGFLARAWLILWKDRGDAQGLSLDSISIESASSALEAVLAAPHKNWLLLRLQYDLVSHVAPYDFEGQLGVLDELGGTEYRVPPQIRLEQAILLHQVGRHAEANQKFASLRIALKQSPAAVSVPERLRWLLVGDRSTRRRCEAQALDNVGFRSMARVRELQSANVPFIAQDFGFRSVPAGMRFQCFVTFGSMGPFLRPATESA